MANKVEIATIQLDQLSWDSVNEVSGGGGFGGSPPTVSPYLWTIFFKADGSTLQVTEALTLSGSASLSFTPGSHGNLGTRSIQVGDSLSIPGAIGQWTSVLLPIPIPQDRQVLLNRDDYPAFFGVVVVILMAEHHVSDHGAEAGHAALNAAVQLAIESLLRSIGPDKPMPSLEDVDNVTKGIDQKVSQAIQDAQSFGENLWSWSGPDTPLGHIVLKWDQSQFKSPLQISEQFDTDSLGSWSLKGTASVIDLCPTSVQIQVLKSNKPSGESITLQAKTSIVPNSDFPGTPSRHFQYNWVVYGADVLETNDATISIKLHENVQQISVAVTVADNFGCMIARTQDFWFLTDEQSATVAALQAILNKIHTPPLVVLNPAGPDPGPAGLLQEIHQYTEKLSQITKSLLEGKDGHV